MVKTFLNFKQKSIEKSEFKRVVENTKLFEKQQISASYAAELVQ